MRPVGEILAGFEALPVTNIKTILAGRRPLILAPHPDDESLGCGGLIAAACAAGLAPGVAIMTDGAASHPGSRMFPPKRLCSLREAETMQALRGLGLGEERVSFMRYPDTGLPAAGDAVLRAITFGQGQDCDLVIGPWMGDPHCDHEACASIATAVAAETGWSLLSYPVWGWLRNRTELFNEPRRGGHRLDITPYLARKQAAIAAHQSQYGGLIWDSPTGFHLPAELLAVFARPFEIYIA